MLDQSYDAYMCQQRTVGVNAGSASWQLKGVRRCGLVTEGRMGMGNGY